MKIVVALKVVADDQDIFASSDRTLDYSKAKPKISEYDLNAIEAGAQLAADNGASFVAISASDAAAGDAKTKKAILSRGPEELFMVADDAMKNADANATAGVLQSLLGTVGDYDLVICGDGSADMYSGQVDVQLAAKLGISVVNAVTAVKIEGDKVVCERTLEDDVEEIEVALPAVVSVAPEAAEPRIAGMKDILAAGKKPATITDLAGANAQLVPTVESVEILAPELKPRANQIFDFATDGDFDKFVDAVVAALR